MNARVFCGALAVAASAWLVATGAPLPPPAAGPDSARHAAEPGDLRNLRDITGIEKHATPPADRAWTLWIWLGAVAVPGFLLVGWMWSRRNGRPRLPTPAHCGALKELDELEARDLPATGQVERYHTLLADLMRRYLERRFRLPASQQTTPEFLDTLATAGPLTAPQQETLASFLRRCDLAKFARAGFTPEECQALAGIARDLIGQTAENSESNGKRGART